MGSRDHSETCEDCGYERGGMNDLECDCDVRRRTWDRLDALAVKLLAHEWRHVLAHNLAWGAALCRAWNLGLVARYVRRGVAVEGVITLDDAAWTPGCGRAAP